MKKIAIMLLSAMVIFSFVACNNGGMPAPSANVSVKWVENMMGANDGQGTDEGNFATSDAMADGAYFDENNQLHARFKAIDNTKFTAYSSGMTGYAYYACYDLDIDALTATSGSTTGTYLFYTIKSDGDTYYGTSNSRAKCTKVDTVDDNAADFEVKYYVVEATTDMPYNRIVNTAYSTLPTQYASLIENETPITITLAGDCVFEDVPASDNQ